MKLHLFLKGSRLIVTETENSEPDLSPQKESTLHLGVIEFDSTWMHSIFAAHLSDTYHQIENVSDRVDRAIELAVRQSYKKSS